MSIIIESLEQTFRDMGEEVIKVDPNTSVVRTGDQTYGLEILEQPIPGAQRTAFLREGASDLYKRASKLTDDDWQHSITINQTREGQNGLNPLTWYRHGVDLADRVMTDPSEVMKKVIQIHGNLLAGVNQRATYRSVRDLSLVSSMMKPTPTGELAPA
jgi:hypothetical protein